MSAAAKKSLQSCIEKRKVSSVGGNPAPTKPKGDMTVSKKYIGNVSVFPHDKKTGEKTLKLRPDVEGAFSNENAAELRDTLRKLAKAHSRKDGIFNPDGKGSIPIILADRWGAPYMALLPDDGKVKRIKSEKLA